MLVTRLAAIWSIKNKVEPIKYHGTATALSVGRSRLAATSIGDYALFGGGSNGSSLSTVDAYDSLLTKTTATDLSVARYYLAATSIGDYALFGGGSDTSTYRNTVDAYDSLLTRRAVTSLSVARSAIAATSIGGYALFGGGIGGGRRDTVDVYKVS